MNTFRHFFLVLALMPFMAVNAQTAPSKPDVKILWCKVSNTEDVVAVPYDTLLAWLNNNCPVTVTDKKSGSPIKVHSIEVTTGIKMQELKTAKVSGNLLSDEMKKLMNTKPDVCYIEAFYTSDNTDANVGLVFKIVK